MNRLLIIFFTATVTLTVALVGCAAEPEDIPDPEPIQFAPNDWPWWRGPHRNGVAAANQDLPLHWSATENVVWSTPVPGRGHGAVTVMGDQLFLATADKALQIQSVICYDRDSGKQQWQTTIHEGGFVKGQNQKASHASSSVACDGRQLFISFLHDGRLLTTALDRSGNLVWQTQISDYVMHQGYGASPAPYESLVIVAADNKGGGAIAGLHRATGQIVWTHTRPKTPNYSSPIILNAAGRDQLVMIGCNRVASFDPLTGGALWKIEGATTECVTSTVTDGQHVFSSGGYPTNHLAAIRADGSGEIVWQHDLRIYVPSMIEHEGCLYAVTDAGVAMCLRCDTGQEQWKKRLGGSFSASLVLADDNLFATNEEGQTFIFKADPEKFQLVAENKLGEELFATPTICGGRIYMRAASYDGQLRSETLYCLGR